MQIFPQRVVRSTAGIKPLPLLLPTGLVLSNNSFLLNQILGTNFLSFNTCHSCLMTRTLDSTVRRAKSLRCAVRGSVAAYYLRGEPCCVLTRAEMTCVSRSATFGWGVSKSTPNSDPLTHFTLAPSSNSGFGSPGTNSCRPSSIPTDTGAFPVMEPPFNDKSLTTPSPALLSNRYRTGTNFLSR